MEIGRFDREWEMRERVDRERERGRKRVKGEEKERGEGKEKRGKEYGRRDRERVREKRG